MYKKPLYRKTQLRGGQKTEGERLEVKIQRMMKNKEPIKDGAPLIFTERKDGVVAAYNIRTDRFEVATEAMDKIAASRIAKRDSKPDEGRDNEGKIVDINKGDAEGKSIHGKADDGQSK